MMTPDAQPAASSAAPTPAAPPSFADYQAQADARDRGVTPEPQTADQPADPASAQPEDQAASTEAKPAASEAAKPRKTAEDRKRELAADIDNDLKRRARIRDEIAREEARLQALRQPPSQETRPTPASEPAPADDFPDYDSFIGLPGNEDKSYETYIRELARHEADQRYEARKREESEKAAREQETKSRDERIAKLTEQITAEGGDEFLESLAPEVRQLRPSWAIRDEKGQWTEQPNGYHALTDRIYASPVGAQLLRHFSDNTADLHRIAKLHPEEFYPALAEIEVGLKSASKAKAGLVQPPPVTTAPDPGTTLGRRPAQPADEITSAVNRNDYASFEAAQNKRDRARYR